MFKKLLVIFIVLLFLITSISVISAADDSNTISVKVLWEDDIAKVPDEVVVNLLKDGKIVDSAKLNDTNSWNTTFEVDDDGDYEIEEVISDDYSTKITGNAKEGFTVKNALAKQDVLGAAEDSLEESSADDNLSQAEEDLASAGDNSLLGDNSTGNGTSNSSTNSSTNNSTNNSTVIATNDDNDTDSNDDDDDSDEKTTTTITTTTTTKKVTKQDDKKPENTTKTKNNNTGFPIIVLVIAVFVAIFVPLSRKK